MVVLRRIVHIFARTQRNVFDNLFFLWLRFRLRVEFRQISSMAKRLQGGNFGELVDTPRSRLLMKIPEPNDALVLSGNGGKNDRPLPGTGLLAERLVGIGIQSIMLDTRLTHKQILKAFLLVLYAGAGLEPPPGQEPRPTGRRMHRIAKELVNGQAFRRFFMLIHLIPDIQLLKIEYVYTKKFSTRWIDAMPRLGHSKKHRTLPKIAPLLGLVSSLVVINMILWIYHPPSGLWFGVTSVVVLGVGVTYLLCILASVQYDREHLDVLLKDSLREITDLSYFSLWNPNPSLKLNAEGELLYANPAAEELLWKLNLSIRDVKDILPDDYLSRITAALESDRASKEVEVKSRRRTLQWRFCRFPKERAVLVTGKDVTSLMKLELELRDINETLEERVQTRTLEVMLMQDVTIMSLSTLAESRDPDTGAHLNRTYNYVRILAETLKNHPRFRELLSQPGVIDKLYRSAPLHDIGKVGTSDAILLKNGRLDENEYKVMKQHTITGGDTFRWAEAWLGTNSFLQFAREIAYYHHEKWDGSGYPFGLQGEDIPISARLMALADVYDAMRSKRCYKQAFSHEDTRDLITSETGSHFDPAVVEAFLEAEEQFIAVAEQYADINQKVDSYIYATSNVRKNESSDFHDSPRVSFPRILSANIA